MVGNELPLKKQKGGDKDLGRKGKLMNNKEEMCPVF